MDEAKKEFLRAVALELGNLVDHPPVIPENALSAAAMQECLRLKWAKKDPDGNFVPTDLGRAMAGRDR